MNRSVPRIHRLLLVILFTLSHLWAKSETDSLKSVLKKSYFSFGMVMQISADYQQERIFAGYNGFKIKNSYAHLKGSFDHKFKYFLQAKFSKSPSILDAYLQYSITNAVSFKIGLFKTPSSLDYETSASKLDMVYRARFVRYFSSKRQIGIRLNWSPKHLPISFGSSITNGNGIQPTGNNDNKFLMNNKLSLILSGRKSHFPGQIIVSFYYTYGEHQNTILWTNSTMAFSGIQKQIGGDIRWTFHKFQLKSEWLKSQYRTDDVRIIYEPIGYYITLIYQMNRQMQFTFRDDYLYTDELITPEDSGHHYILGFNYTQSSYSRIQLNYVCDSNKPDVKHHQIIIQFQFSI